MKEKKETPMMAQYRAVKDAHPDCLVFFRLGDFYEMFQEDARIGARELDLTLTTRDRGKPEEERVPMCGVPHHAVQSYLTRLTAKGYKVVVCEQMEDPAQAQGLVDRDVVRIVTPGTLVESEGLREDANSFLASLWLEESWAGLAFCDLSTGETDALAVSWPSGATRLFSELESRTPRELILNDTALSALSGELKSRLSCPLERGKAEDFEESAARAAIYGQFRYTEGVLLAEEGDGPAVRAVGGLLAYLRETQRMDTLPHFNTIRFHRDREYMELDRATRLNLELTETLRGKEKKGSLLWIMDRAVTPMGHRKLRAWMERPLVSAYQIKERQDGVAALVKDFGLQARLHKALAGVGDLERMVARLSVGGGNARDLMALALALEPLPRLAEALEGVKTAIFKRQLRDMDPLEDLSAEIRRAIKDKDLPLTVREGGIIAPGYDREIDEYRELMEGGAGQILAIEARERARTGIRTLKTGYNRVFGYYIEVSNSFKDQVPGDYIRKQTLVNGERYITQELKELEERFLTAKEKCAQREYALFCGLRDRAVSSARAIQKDAAAVATVDVLLAFAALALDRRYVRPTVDKSGVLEIKEGRHPVVERTLEDGLFVPNDTCMDPENTNVALITGPNMAGKSTYMRQVALIVLMAQMGSYVPASAARIGVVDRVFTRIGASDDLNAGQSTFMVEMTEVAEILREATPRSLIIMDEVGRGTSTYDGMAIAGGVLNYLCTDLKAKTFFSTHYHELIDMERTHPNLKNYNIAVKKRGGELVFLRKILPGGADDSYGIEVAQMADLPEKVIQDAKVLLRWSEEDALDAVADRILDERARELQDWREEEARAKGSSAWKPAPTPGPIMTLLEGTNPDALSPIEAWQLVTRLKAMAAEEEGT